MFELELEKWIKKNQAAGFLVIPAMFAFCFNKKIVGTSSHIPIRSGGLAEEFSIQSRIGKLRYLDKLKDLDSASKDIPTNSLF